MCDEMILYDMRCMFGCLDVSVVRQQERKCSFTASYFEVAPRKYDNIGTSQVKNQT